jgi:hypothetical protein
MDGDGGGLMADVRPESEKPADPAPGKSPLAALSGDAGCVILGIPLAAAGASVYIFEAAVKAGSPWAGAAATAALCLMGLGTVWVLARNRD